MGRHEKWRARECINLIPSENITSPAVRQLLTTDMGHRYRADDRFYKGTRYLDEIESLGEEIATNIFGTDWASLRPLSGHMADMIAISTLTRPGDLILSVSPDNGGYHGISGEGYPPLVGVKNLYFPYDSERMNIQVEKSRDLITKERPKLAIFGQSYFLFPHPVKDLIEACRSAGSRIAFDGSHVLGLIAGGLFQSPIEDGAELLIGSTHKSLFGPQGGIVTGNKNVEHVKAHQYPGLVDNAHWNRIAALCLALDEARRNGKKYASQVVRNAKALARALYDRGIPVKCANQGFTESHQVLLDLSGESIIDRFTGQLEKSNLIVDRGVRLGTCEVTRRGMREDEMERIAEMVADVYNGGDTMKVKRAAMKLRKGFNSLRFT